MSDQADQQRLLGRITSRRRSIEEFLAQARPRVERWTLVSVISSSVAAALTAGPAVGGAGFTQSMAAGLGIDDDAIIWRILCLLALVASIVAAVTMNLSKSKNTEARIISAEACNAELEGLQTLLEFGQVPLPEAVKMYQRYVAKIPFVPDTAPTIQLGHRPPPA
jgi:MFS family permease